MKVLLVVVGLALTFVVSCCVGWSTTSYLNSRLNELDSTDEFNSIASSTKLTSRNFAHQMKSSHYYLVLFYAPWCEYCLQLLPQWTKLAGMITERFRSSVQVGHVDCIAEEAFCTRVNVADYPTLRAYSRGPPMKFESIQVHELDDTIEYLEEYMLNLPTENFRHQTM
ncbi:uncharacterized protein LOC131428444 [Malaya genurostris]|uniref:uncharacterized protein LOC131428444 n=1 Tax=Malaya genurostris TaxID=325434 RepID=UPI0026F37FF7|nr:uncharacterized protein LOC131428444 [Malaya genurostris]